MRVPFPMYHLAGGPSEGLPISDKV